MTALPEGTITLQVRNMRNVYTLIGNTILSPYGNAPVIFNTLEQVQYFVTLQQKGSVTTNDVIPADVVALLNQIGEVVPAPIPAVTLSLAGGIYTSPQTVTLTPNISTTTVYFTVDNSTPKTSSNIYVSPIAINETTTLKYFAANADGTSSTVQQVTYTIINQSGENGTGDVEQKELIVAKEPFSGNATVTHTFSNPMDYFAITNDDATNNLTFTIGSETVTVAPNGKFDDKFDPFTSVTVTTTVAFRAYGKKIIGTTQEDFIVADGLAGSTTATKTFVGKAREILINNSGSADLTFSVNGVTFPVKAGEFFDEQFDPFQSVTVNATTPFEAYFKGISSEISPDVTPPANVAANTPLNITTSSVRLSWNAVGDADLAGYNVYNGATKLNSTLLISTLFDCTGLLPATQYNFVIKSVDKVGNESSGSTVTVTTSASQLPNNVTNLNATNITSNSLVLSWTASSSPNIQDYLILQNGIAVATVVGTNYAVIGLNSSTAYEFTVKTINTSGYVSSGVSTTATTTAVTAPTGVANVTNLTYTGLTATSVTLNWTASVTTSVVAYDIYSQGAAIATTAANTYTFTNLAPNTTYAYTVFAKDSSNNVSSGVLINFTTPVS